jgi:hypothetical protein
MSYSSSFILFFCVSPLPRESAYRAVNQQCIIPCLFVAVGTCVASRWLEMDFCSGSTILAFRRHVTIVVVPAGIRNLHLLHTQQKCYRFSQLICVTWSRYLLNADIYLLLGEMIRSRDTTTRNGITIAESQNSNL